MAFMTPGPRWPSGWAAVIAAALILITSSGAAGAPTPDQGPTAGGTVVTDALPARVTFTAIDSSGNAGFAQGTDGRFYAWGSGASGQLGNGVFATSFAPTAVLPPVDLVEVWPGGTSSLALGADGVLYAWGDNVFGQLGNGSNDQSATAVPVSVPAGVTFVQWDTSGTHAAAIADDGTAWAWGDGLNGQLGTGTTAHSALPVPMILPAGVTATQISTGGNKTFVIGSDGVTYAWGRGFNSGLGTGSTADALTASPVLAPTGVTFTQVYAGQGDVTLARGSDGNLYSWGLGTSGQLGNGAPLTSGVPVQVIEPPGVTLQSFSIGGNHILAVGSDGQVYGWGSGASGRFGDGTSTNRLVPTLVQAPAGLTFTQGAAVAQGSILLASDGETYAVGSQNGSGTLGDGTNQNTMSLVLVAVGGPVVDAVTFGGAAGTGLGQDAATWTATTPAHPCGPVDVAVTSTQMGLSTTTVTPAGFTFGTAPTIRTDPADATVAAGSAATLTATATGDDAPAVQWQQRTDPGAPWQDVPGATSTTLTVTPTTGGQYQAVFSNCLDSVTSAVATLTLTAAPGGPQAPLPQVVQGGVDPVPAPARTLALSGADPAMTGLAALATLLAGTGLVALHRRRVAHGR